VVQSRHSKVHQHLENPWADREYQVRTIGSSCGLGRKCCSAFAARMIFSAPVAPEKSPAALFQRLFIFHIVALEQCIHSPSFFAPHDRRCRNIGGFRLLDKVGEQSAEAMSSRGDFEET